MIWVQAVRKLGAEIEVSEEQEGLWRRARGLGA